MKSCPSSDQLLHFLAEQLHPDQRAAVMDHVDACPPCQDRLSELTNSADSVLHVTPTNAWSPSEAFVRQITRAEPRPKSSGLPEVPGYEILSELGRGGMGVVYQARQLGLNRLVALKMVLAGAHASEEQQTRFRLEAEAVARLRHPNIIQVFEIGEQHGQPFLALEYAEGGSLSNRLDGKPQAPAAAVELLETLARAIHAAHERGVIHRDLKPANILFAALTPKITDFGLAKVLDHDTVLTRTGDVLGTPSYLAPEQAQPHLRDQLPGGGLGPATDVYALGAILYELLTGRPPFMGETPVGTVLQVLHQEPVPPAQLQPRVPPDLATICLKCLEKEPHKRYASAAALADDLRRFREGEPIMARRVGSFGRLWRWSRRRPLLAALAAALLLSLVGGLAGMSALWLRAEGHRQNAETHAANAEQRRQESEANLYLSRLAQARLAWRLNDVEESQHLLERCVPEAGATDWRGWEWHYLKSLAAAELLTLPAGFEHAQCVLFSPDGQRLILARGDPYARPEQIGDTQIWDLAPLWQEGKKPELVHTLDERQEMIFALACGYGRLVTGGRHGAIRVWDLAAAKKTATLAGHQARIVSLTLDADGTRVASVDARHQARVWDLRSGKTILQCTAAWARFAPSGDTLLTSRAGDPAGRLTRWDLASGKAGQSLAWGVHRWEFSPDGRKLVAWDSRGVRILDATTGQVTATLSGHAGEIRDAQFSPDGLHVATAGVDKTARVWNAHTGAEQMVLRGHAGRVGSVAFHPNGRYLATAGHQPGDVKLWDLTRQPDFLTTGGLNTLPRAVPLDAFGPPLAVCFGPGNQFVRVAYREQIVRSFDPRGVPLDRPTRWVPLAGNRRAAFSPDGTQLAAVYAGDPRLVNIWDPDSAALRQSLRHAFSLAHLAWSPGGKQLVTISVRAGAAGGKRELRVWDASSGNCLTTLQPADIPVEEMTSVRTVAALAPDGALVAYDEREGGTRYVQVRAVASGEAICRFAGHEAQLSALAFSADGRYLASVDFDGRLLVHDLRTGQPLYPRPLKAPTAYPGDVAFSPDGRLLAVVDREQVKVWHVRWGQEVLVLRGAPPRLSDNAFVPRLAWSSDGRYLLASNHELTLSIWDSQATESLAERVQTAEARSFGWHLAHVRATTYRTPDPFAAGLHFQALQALEPPTAGLALNRGTLYAQLGRWPQAAADFAAAFRGQPFDHPRLTYQHALLRFHAGDLEGWRAACAHLRRQFEQAQERLVADALVRACCLGSASGVEWEQLLSWTDGADRFHETFSLAGAARYRAGRPAEAIPACEESLRDKVSHNFAPVDALFLTMAYVRDGKVEQARQALGHVQKWLAQHEAGETSAGLPRSVDWIQWLELQVLLPEAEAALQSAAR